MNRYLLTALALLAATGMTARHLTPEEALDRLAASGMRRAPAVAVRAPQLLYSASAGDTERVYVFGTPSREGFMVLSADDVVPALLAYSDSGVIDTSDIPDNLRYWLDEYARQIQYAARSVTTEPTGSFRQRATVEPKITTMWDQTEPFNELTPHHSGLPTPTGCVATALAQIMNWHKWPAQPIGKKTFSSYYVGTLSIDFDQISFDWDKMLDRYYKDSPAENINAVATLMMAVGYGAEMTYHQKASGATGYRAANAMFTHFGYSKSLSLERREWYGIEEWEDLVYAELTGNGPVYYEGDGDGGGHAFVCDGYDGETGLFHFNWGWSGRGNGYYRLSALDPDYQGTGGNSLGYNYTQDIIRGLKPAPAGVTEEPVEIFSPRMGVTTPYETRELGGFLTFLGYETEDGFCNYSVVPLKNVDFGARIHNVATGEDSYVASTNGTYDFEPYTKVNVIRFNLPDALAEGEYTLTPVWRTNAGAWRSMRMSPNTRNYVPMTVSGTTATFGIGIAGGRMEVTLTEAPEFFTTNGEFTLKGSLASVGEKDFSGLLCAVFVRNNDKGELEVIDQGDVVRIDLEPGRTREWEYTSTPQKGKLTDGDDYGLVIGNANTGELLSPIYSVKVGNRYGTLQMSSYNFKIERSTFLDPAAVSASVKIRVVAGEYEGPLALGYSLKKDPVEPVRYTVGESVHLMAGDDKEVYVTGTLDNVEAGELYYVHLFYKDKNDHWKQLSEYPVMVVVANSYSGVENLGVEEAPVYYDTFGRKVVSPAAGGVYIRVSPGGRTSKVVM